MKKILGGVLAALLSVSTVYAVDFSEIYTSPESYISYGLATDGTLWRWGGDVNADPDDWGAPHVNPEQVDTSTDWASVRIGAGVVHLVKDDGSRYIIGDLSDVGDGSTGYTSTPVEVSDGGGWSIIDSDGESNVGITDSGSLYVWGANINGQVGTGSSEPTPAQIFIDDGGPESWTDTYAYNATTFAFRSNGELWAWGAHTGSVLSATPVLVGTGYVSVYEGSTSGTGEQHVVALKEDGSMWGWTQESAGSENQLNNGYAFGSTTPVQIDAGPYVEVFADENASYGLKADGSLWMIGATRFYNAAYGTLTQIASNVEDVYPLRFGFMARQSDGTIWGAGLNGNGSLGFGDNDLKLAYAQTLLTYGEPLNISTFPDGSQVVLETGHFYLQLNN